MSCMTPAADGLRLSIDDPEVRAFRAQVIEWLMVNHPHDCPVCDEGGECLHRAERKLLIAGQRRRAQQRRQHLDRFGAASAIQGSRSSGQHAVRGGHREAV